MLLEIDVAFGQHVIRDIVDGQAISDQINVGITDMDIASVHSHIALPFGFILSDDYFISAFDGVCAVMLICVAFCFRSAFFSSSAAPIGF